MGGVCGIRDFVSSRPRSFTVAHKSVLHKYVTTEDVTGYAQCINTLQQKVYGLCTKHKYVTTEDPTGYAQCINTLQQKVYGLCTKHKYVTTEDVTGYAQCINTLQ